MEKNINICWGKSTISGTEYLGHGLHTISIDVIMRRWIEAQFHGVHMWTNQVEPITERKRVASFESTG